MKKYLLSFIFVCSSLTTICGQESTTLLNQVSPQLISGTKIAIADAYYVTCYAGEGDGVIRAATSYDIDSVPYSVGWNSLIFTPSSPLDPTFHPNFPTLFIGLYDFDMPVYFDETQNRLWFKAGSLLATKETSQSIASGTIFRREIKCLYAVPEQWLYYLNDTATYIISGNVNNDGSLFIDGGIAFLIDYQYIDTNTQTGEKVITYSSSCTLSPVYRNIHIINPNGIHEYTQVTDRYNIDSSLEERMKDSIQVIDEEVPTPHGHGGGGRVIRPIDPRPIRSRLLNNVSPNAITLSSNGFMCQSKSVLLDNKYGDICSFSDPVYMIQVNDSTLYVYNLYGMISEVNVIYLKKHGQMTIPVQPFDQSTEHSIYCFSRFATPLSGNASKDQISWGTTVPVDYQGLKDYYFYNNSLKFIDKSKFYIPDSAVRGDVNMDGDISIRDVTELISFLLSSYSDASIILGKVAYDCNQDDNITIADVTVLINYLLSGTW